MHHDRHRHRGLLAPVLVLVLSAGAVAAATSATGAAPDPRSTAALDPGRAAHPVCRLPLPWRRLLAPLLGVTCPPPTTTTTTTTTTAPTTTSSTRFTPVENK